MCFENKVVFITGANGGLAKSPEFLNFFIIESRIPNSWYLQRL